MSKTKGAPANGTINFAICRSLVSLGPQDSIETCVRDWERSERRECKRERERTENRSRGALRRERRKAKFKGRA